MSEKTTGAYAEELKLRERMQTERLKSAEQLAAQRLEHEARERRADRQLIFDGQNRMLDTLVSLVTRFIPQSPPQHLSESAGPSSTQGNAPTAFPYAASPAMYAAPETSPSHGGIAFSPFPTSSTPSMSLDSDSLVSMPADSRFDSFIGNSTGSTDEWHPTPHN